MSISHHKDPRQNEDLKVTTLALGVNLFLVIVKVSAGWLGNSRALIADGIHSAADLLTDVIAFFGILLGSKPADEDHHFGHQKIETLFEILLGILLMGTGGVLMFFSARAVYFQDFKEIAPYTAFVALLSLIVNEWLFRVAQKVSKKTDNRITMINAWHHRTDALTSFAVFVGLLLSYFVASLRIIDPLLSLLVGVLIFKIGFDSSWDAIKRITDTVPIEKTKQVKEIVRSIDNILDFHGLKMSYVGAQLHVEIHIEVDRNLTLFEGHEIAHRLEDKIEKEMPEVLDVTVHVEPEGDDDRVNEMINKKK